MKLAHVNFAWDPALATGDDLLDAYHTLTGWSDAAAAAGCEVTVVQGFSRDGCVRRGAVTYVFRSHRGGVPGAMYRAIADMQPDVVHINGFDMMDHACRLRRLLPSHAALVVQDHGAVFPPRRAIRRALLRRRMRDIDGFLFTSAEQGAPWLAGGLIREPQRVHAVVEASTTMRPIDRGLARSQSGVVGDPAVLWVGRLDANKDPLTVLDGFERALTVLPRATLTMVYSDAPLLADVQRRIARSEPLVRAVRLAGAVPRSGIAAFFTAADLFVSGSGREAAGYSLIEACACGAVPVVTDIAPFRAITGDGAVGRLWSRGSAEGCAAAIVDAHARGLETGRTRLHAHFERHLSWAAVGRRAAAVYRGVVERRRAGRTVEAAC